MEAGRHLLWMGLRSHRCTSDVMGEVDDVVAAESAETLAWPHVVSVFDRLLGLPTVLGPFPDPVSASVFAERYAYEVTGNSDRESLRVDVVPLEHVVMPPPASGARAGTRGRVRRRWQVGWRW